MFKIKSLVLTLVLQSTLVHAYFAKDRWAIEDLCTNLKLQIINHSQSTCNLITYQMLSGVVLHNDDIPKIIFAGESSRWFELSENAYSATDIYGDAIHFFAHYECGEGKMVTFIAEKDKCRRSRAVVRGMVVSEYNLDTNFEFSDGSMRDNTPGTILLTLSEKQ